MSLNYDYLFSQIDKAKKKRWTQADTDKWVKQQKEEKEKPKSREQIGESFTRISGRKRGKQVGDKKESESTTRVPGRKRGRGTVTSTGEKTTRNDQTVPSTAEVRIQDLGETGTKEKRGLDRKGLKRDYAKEKKRRQDKKDAKDLQEKELKEGIPASHSTLGPKSHTRYRTVIDAKGNRVSVPVTSRPERTDKKPISRKGKLRQESGAYAIRGTEEGNKKLREADARFQKERDTMSITSFAAFLADRKKNPPPSGGFVSVEDVNDESEATDYKKWVADREASAKKREEDKKERESIDSKTKLPKGPKVKPKPKKETPKEPPKVEAYQSEGDPNPEVEGGIDGDDEYSEYEKEGMKDAGKSLWKSWLENKVDMKRHKRPEEYEKKETIEEKWNKGEQEKRQVDPKVQVETREGESYEKYKERQDAAEEPREEKTLTQRLDDMGVTDNTPDTPERTQYPEPATSAPAPATSAPEPKTPSKPSGGFVQDEDDYKNLGKALWKSWLEKKIDPKDCPYCKGNWSKNRKERWEMEDTGGEAGRLASIIQQWHDNDPDHFHATVSYAPPEMQEASDRDEERRKRENDDKLKAAEANKGSHSIKLPMSDNLRKLVRHHEEERIKREKQEKKLRGSMASDLKDELKAEEGMGGMNMGAQRGLGHEAGYKQGPGQSTQITEVKDEEEESKKSAYENHEQDEGPEVKPNKQQIPASKPGTDVFKSLYKKALIIKYKNIYKPLNT